jgi:UDP-galactopyranose mutase
MYKYIVVGAGLAGSVMAERIANILDQDVLIIEKRDHIGGNCYDCLNEDGILIHKYGPHIFHTQLEDVWNYLSQFTQWISYQHRVLGFVDGKLIPIPFNLNSLRLVFPSDIADQLESLLIERFSYGASVPILKLKEFDKLDEINDKTTLSYLADYIYQKVFLNYTKKQWGLLPEELDPLVTERVPVRISSDDCYFQDPFQGIPLKGYTSMFEKMLEHPRIKLILGTDYNHIMDFDFEKKKIFIDGNEFTGKLIFTGEIDEFFNYRFGKLPYRSMDFLFETLDQEFFQEAATINYPNDYDFTRITEFKLLTGQIIPKTTIMREYPKDYDENYELIPSYPVPMEKNRAIYLKYKEMAAKMDNIIFLGRLAEYEYYNMDIVVSNALNAFKELENG